ncbi:glycosyltransferase family 4 protein [Peribacillus tepidiphilus]|uniref:glycosyltransferase family 4 protein n=1 Tax=Peribacillus tepidiphilus TaxID=2652445 RepID=UPI0035B52748
MKILMICTEKLPVPPVLGGAIQTYISGVLPHLRKQHDITVLGTDDPSLPNQETIDGIHYVRIPGKIFEIYREGVEKYVQSNQFDLIHIFNRPRLVIPVRNTAPEAKIVLSMHNDMFEPEKIDSEEAMKLLEEVSQIVTVSDYIGNVIKSLYPQAESKVRTIYSGVDIERFLPGNHSSMKHIRNDIRKANGLENKKVLLFAGRLSNNKGVDKLVRAIPELSKKFKDLALVIMGSKWFSLEETTDYIAYVRSLAKKLPIPVVATGFVAPSKIQNWFAAADLFVCTSQWQEPLARVHYEAMAAGLPIVTTARGGNPEVIHPRENGLVVERPEDPSCFAEHIGEILSNSSLMRKMGEKGRELAVSRYTWDRVASELLEVWEQSKTFVKKDVDEKMKAQIINELDNELGNDLENKLEDEKFEEKIKEKSREEKKKKSKEEKKNKFKKEKKKKYAEEMMLIFWEEMKEKSKEENNKKKYEKEMKKKSKKEKKKKNDEEMMGKYEDDAKKKSKEEKKKLKKEKKKYAEEMMIKYAEKMKGKSKEEKKKFNKEMKKKYVEEMKEKSKKEK